MQDPLNYEMPLSGIDTQIPVLPNGDYLTQVKKSEIRPNKDNTGHNWHLEFGLAAPATDTKGKEVKIDFPLFQDIALQPGKDAKDAEGFKRGIAQAVDAIFGTDISTRPAFNMALVQSAVGKMVVAQSYADEYPKGSGNFNNKISRLKKAQ